MPPPPPPGSDMPAMMAWMKQAFDIFQSTQTPQPAPVHSVPTQPQQSPNPASGGPNVQPPPGMMWAWIPNFGFALMPAGGGSSPGGGPSLYRRPPPYGSDRESPPYPGRHEPPPPPQRERTAAEQFREAISVVRTAVDAVGEMNTMLPNFGGGASEPSSGDEDADSPVKVIDTGRGKFVLDKTNGGFRGWESLYANLPDLLKWAGEQREEIQKMNTRQRPQQLPAGYVEVGPGYQPPPGFVAVPVDPQQPLPPPPTNMPPPIQPSQSWGEPVFPENKE